MKSNISTKNNIYNYNNSISDNGSNDLVYFDFSKIDAKDPSLSESHKLIYNREFPFELRLEDN